MRARASDGIHRRFRRSGLAALCVAIALAGTGCGTRASDGDIVDALRAGEPSVAPEQAGLSPGVATDANIPAEVAAPVGPGPNSPGVADQGTTATETTGGANPAEASGPAKTGAQQTAPLVANKSVVKIGQLGPFSGALGALTEPVIKSFGAWVSYKNATGGLNGHPIKVIVGDDQGDPSTALTLARRMVESDRIIAMAGGVTVFGFAQLEKYMREKNVPIIGDGIDPGHFTSPVAFPVVSPMSVQTIKGLKTFVDAGATKLATTYCLEVSALCTYLNEEVKKSEIGKYVVQSYQVSLVAPSYTSQCLRMKQGGIEVMWLLMDTASAARLVQDCATQGFKPKVMLSGLDAMEDMPTIPALADATIPGATVSPAADIPAVDKMHRILAEYAPGYRDNGYGAYAWVAGEMLGVAGKGLPESPLPADMFAGLWKVKNNDLGGLTSPLTYPQGKPAQVKPCFFFWGTANGKWTAPKGAKAFC